jgi:hypothetical protein
MPRDVKGGESAGQRIRREALSWPGVSGHPHRFGGTEFRLGRRELGHIHGDELIDIPLPRRIRDEAVAAGKASPHHVLPDSGWVSVRLRSADDVQHGLELLRLSYDLAIAQRSKRSMVENSPGGNDVRKGAGSEG